MSAGIKTWAANGAQELDIATRLLRGLTIVQMGNGSGSVQVSSGGGQIIAYVKGIPGTFSEERSISVSGSTVSWSAGRGNQLYVLAY